MAERNIHALRAEALARLAEAMQAALTSDEAERLTTYLCPLVEAEQGTKRYAWAYLWALKPADANDE